MKKRGRALALLLATVLTVSSVPGTVLAAEGIRPQDGTTKEQPFLSGTGGSSQFRIPCLVSLDDGTIVAGCDARWNTSGDGGGLDTIVSRSTDKGKTWHYTFANYLGDNGNAWNNYSTAFIDPAMATDGKRVYMIADLYPAGYALNSAKYPPVPGKSHDKDGNILLADASSWENCWVDARKDGNNYTYHLEKNDKKKSDSAYVIKDADGKAVDGYTVDAYFNIKGNGVDTNLFEAESPFQVWPTDYLYLTTSEDGGATWSVPTIVNARRETEQSLLVGPGRGMVTSTGRIIFTAYEYTNGDKNSVAIYSDDEGKTWTRGQSVSSQSSEAVVTEANGKLYMFTRHGGYYTSEDFGETWSPKQEMGINYRLYCQLTAITYPKKIDGKTAILFAAPSSVSDRSAGKIFVGLVQDDGKLNWKYNYSVNGSDPYGYSCLTVLPDGTVGLLYEGSGIVYEDFDIADIAKGAAIGNIWCTDENGPVAEVTMTSNGSKELTVNGLKNGAEVEVSTDNDKAVTAAYANGKVTLTSKAVTGMERADVTVESAGEKTTVSVIVTDSENYEIVDLRVGDTKTYTDKTGNYSGGALEGLDTDIAEVTVTGEDAQAVEKRAKVQLATSEGHFDGTEKTLDDCLFTFAAADGQDNTYTMSAKDGDKTVYVNYRSAASAGTVCAETTANIKLEERTDDQTFELFDQTPGNHGNRLYFYKDNEGKLHFDRNTGDHANCRMELYKKAANGSAESAIPGYEKVTGLDQITDGGKYLIAAKAASGAYYVVNPSSAGEKYKHVAKVVEENVPVEEENESEVTKDGIVTVEKREDMPPYKAISEIAEGTYLFGSRSHIMLNTVSTAEGTQKGLGMKAVNFNNDETAKDFMWTIAKSGEGYTMKDAASGKYINISGNDVELKDTAQVLTIGASKNGGFAVSAGGYYLNNWAGGNNKVAAYQSDDNSWYFYKASSGNVAAGAKEGTVTAVTSEGTNYKITVVKEAPEPPVEKTYTVTAAVNNETMGTASLDKEGPEYKEGTELTATAKVKDESKYEFVNWTSGDEVVSKDAEYTFTVEKDMQLTANFQAKEDPEEPQPPKPPVTEDTFKLNVTVNDDKMGTVKLDPAKVSYEAGETVKAIATAKEGYKFLNWTVDGKVVSDKAEYTFIVDRTVTLKANFAKVSEDPKDKDKAVQTGDNSVSPIIPLAGLALAAGAAVTVLRKKED